MGWSAWQSPWLASFPITQSGKYFAAAKATGTDPSTTATIAPMTAAAKATILAGGGTAETGWGSSEILAYTQGNRDDDSTDVQVELGYSASVFDAGLGEDFSPSGIPPTLEAMTFGTDYDTIPVGDRGPYTDGSALLDYEGSGQTFAQWDVLQGNMFLHLTGSHGGGGSLPNPIPVPLRLWGYTALTPHSGNATAGPTLGYAPSNVIGDVDFSADFAGTPSGNFAQDVGDLDLSGQSEAFTIVVQSRWQGAETVLSNEITSGFGFYQLFVFTQGLSATAQALYTTQRWRYWIPDVPETSPLRTIGDHFQSVGGAQVYSLVDGSWVPVRLGI